LTVASLSVSRAASSGVECRQDDDPAEVAGLCGEDAPGGLETVHLRHPDVHENDVGTVLEHRGDRLGAVGRLGRHRYPGRVEDHEKSGLVTDPDFGPRSPGVLEHIGERLLHHPECGQVATRPTSECRSSRPGCGRRAAASSGRPAGTSAPPAALLLALSGLAIAVLGALLPAIWAARSRTVPALHAE
jgi:hypothetical protein